ncbi:MAG TPA: SDR family oxidoreductase [Steroidobacteraceae bacterium]|nr:SDR family oxidoreductase [Steroidobacteraceae bacterium]
MSPRFIGKATVVIGGNSGIGLAAARAFAAEGAQVAITGRDPVSLARAAATLGPGALAIRSDMANLREIVGLMEEIRRKLGRIDVLFVNAGVGAFLPIEAVTEEDWDGLMAVNLKGVFFTVQKALPLMARGSAIVLNSSMGWKKGIPTGSVYSASKAGVRALGRSFAAELVGRGIRVNVVSPGPIETPIINRTAGLTAEMIPELRRQMIANTPMRRLGAPEEVARAALFLASEEASFVTGIDMLVDGGAASL